MPEGHLASFFRFHSSRMSHSKEKAKTAVGNGCGFCFIVHR
nr:MAG TPA: Carboxymuconolactone decarboxylase family protein [Caudoviricetes sp.]